MKEDKENKPKSDSKELKKVNNAKKDKEKLGTRFINIIKKRWLISGTNTLLLIAIIIAIVILINSMVQSLDLTAIDCTTSKDYTLTDESKERVADIEETINVYFVGYDEDDTQVKLAKQYNKANSNINVEVIDATENLDIANKYDVSNDDYAVIVENGDISITIDYYDLYTYDSNYNTVDLTEQKITSAILNVTSGYIPTVYFLEGYTSLGFDYSSGLYFLSQYLDDEVLTYSTLNLLTTGAVPEDCDTLVIMTPESDFDDITTNAIIDYINRGGNILWLQSAVIDDSIDYTNVNKILALYGVDSFELGYIYETDSNNIILNSAMYYLPEIESTTVTNNLDNIVFIQSTKININEDGLEDLDVTETDLLVTSDSAYFSTDLTGQSTTAEDEQGSFVVGAEFVKTISDGTDEEEETEETEDEENVEEESEDEETEEDSITSTLIIYGDNYFIADYMIQYGSSYLYSIDIYQNKDLMLNSIAYLTNNYEDITIRKSYSDSTTTFTATEAQKAVIMRIIFLVPIAIILFGIVVWQIRRRKK